MMQELANWLVAFGHSVTVITGWPNHPEGILFDGWTSKTKQVSFQKNVKLVRCGHSFKKKSFIKKMIFYLTFAFSSFLNFDWGSKPDVVLCLSTPLFGTWSSYLISKLKKCKFIYAIYDLHPESAKNAGLIREKSFLYQLMKFQDSLLCKWSNVIITLSEMMKKEKVEVIPVWLDGKRIKPVCRLNKWRELNSIHESKFVVLYSGTLGYISGADIIVEVAHLMEEYEDILFLCVGDGGDKEGMVKHSQILGLKNIFYLPFQKEKYLEMMQGTADLCIVTLLSEAGKTSVPSKILGYMSAGRPTLASVSKESETARIIEKYHCGVVVSPQNSNGIMDSVLFLKNNDKLRSVLGQNGRKAVENIFNKDVCCKKYFDTFHA